MFEQVQSAVLPGVSSGRAVCVVRGRGDGALAQRGAAVRGLQHGARRAAAGPLPQPPPGLQR